MTRPDGNEGGKPGNPDGGAAGAGDFDAVAAAAELAESLGLDNPDASGGADAYVATLEQEIEQLNALLDQRDVELRQAKATVVKATEARQAALDDVERAGQRIEKEAAKKMERRRRKVLLEFLEVLDDLDRALAAARDTAKVDTVVDGIELVRRSFMTRLAQFNVAHVPALGAPFDPELHDAVTTMAVDDAGQDNCVVAVTREGYTIGEECLRAAQVVVGKAQ